ncbi:hypothetical protein EIP91_009717 [Steccherinum ochraceum]|uniref:Uncharacterized protein n=1 Tax=Steccherinum ochraceum TaxID=92696 RepID=A0A4R0R1B9_9APHY|nr:hypothetical protein EIP91_009717 [Steccherinum ochraceum]
MPGPRNQKSRKKAKPKKDKRVNKSATPEKHETRALPQIPDSVDETQLEEQVQPAVQEVGDFHDPRSPPTQAATSSPGLPPSEELPSISNRIPSPFDSALTPEHDATSADSFALPDALFKPPFIEDPGTGIRVRDMHEFLASRFAAPPSLEDELCAEFAQEEVLQMLCSVLPDEIALILWYNKSRLTARICPACQRLYRLGDILHDPLGPTVPPSDPENEARVSENRQREQEISGLCSPVCFILAAFNYPAAIRSTWGRMAEDLSDETWGLLDAPPTQEANDMGLGMLLKMTRCHDLGLGQLLFPDLDFEDGEEGQDDEEDQSDESAEGYGDVVPSPQEHGWEQTLKDLDNDVAQMQIRLAQDDDNEDLRQ